MNIPEGWKLVPVEPTLGMAEAGAHSTGDNVDGRPVWKAPIDEQAAHIYRAMLAAAPTPPVQQDDEALELLKLALEAMSCGDTGDDLDDSHRCGKCDEYVDRNGPVRQRIRAMLAKRSAA